MWKASTVNTKAIFQSFEMTTLDRFQTFMLTSKDVCRN